MESTSEATKNGIWSCINLYYTSRNSSRINHRRGDDYQVELEMRLRSPSEQSSVDIQSFYVLRNILSAHFSSKKVKYTSESYNVEGNSFDTTIRKRIQHDGDRTIVSVDKKRVQKRVIDEDLGFKLALSTESRQSRGIIAGLKPSLIRVIERESFLVSNESDILPVYEGAKLRIDMSIVRTKFESGKRSSPSYEVEVEVVELPGARPPTDLSSSFTLLARSIHSLMGSIHMDARGESLLWLNKNSVTPGTVKRFINSQLKSGIPEGRFSLASVMNRKAHKAVDMPIDALFSLASSYSVTVKIDGERALLYTLAGYSYLVNYRRVVSLGYTAIPNSIVDCEIYLERLFRDQGDKAALRIFCFDIISYSSSDTLGLRSSLSSAVNKPFTERYDILMDIMNDVTIPGVQEIVVKEYRDATTEGIFDTLDTSYRNDGLIFTAKNLKYTDNNSSFKWKERMTIDLYVSKAVQLMFSRSSKWIPLSTSFQGYPISFDEAVIRKYTGKIIELVAFLEDGIIKLEFDRIRRDRDSPNNFKTVVSILKIVIRPITRNTITGNNLLPGIRYLNMYKRCLIERTLDSLLPMSVNSIRLLDIGSGAGADVFKWKSVGEITALEPDPSSFAELSKRVSKSNNNIVPVNTTLEEYKFSSPFSAITSFFSMTQILAPNKASYKSFVSRIGDMLLDGGIFMGVYMDPDLIYPVMNGKTQIEGMAVERVNEDRIMTSVDHRQFEEYIVNNSMLYNAFSKHFEILMFNTISEFSMELNENSKELVHGHRVIIAKYISKEANDELSEFESLLRSSGELAMTSELMRMSFETTRKQQQFTSMIDLNGPQVHPPRRNKNDQLMPIYRCSFSLNIPDRGNMLTCIRYITRVLDSSDKPPTNALIIGDIYIHYATLLAVLFPTISFDVFQSSTDVRSSLEWWFDNLKIENKSLIETMIPRINLKDGIMTLEDTSVYQEQNNLIVIGLLAETDDDLMLQRSLIRNIQPKYCACLFYVPKKGIKYFEGEHHAIAWNKQTSETSMLVLTGNKMIKYDRESYTPAMCYHNNVRRQWGVYRNNRTFSNSKTGIEGYDRSYDCTFESDTWKSYYGHKPAYIAAKCCTIVRSTLLRNNTSFSPNNSLHGKFGSVKSGDEFRDSYDLRLRKRLDVCGKNMSSSETKEIDTIIRNNPHCSQLYLNPQFKNEERVSFTRTLTKSYPSLPYSPSKSKINSTLHWGQRKLLISEIEFLTRYALGPRSREKFTLVYVGAAGGHHIPILVKLFPNVRFVLYDKGEFSPSLIKLASVYKGGNNDMNLNDIYADRNRVIIVKGYFDEGIASMYSDINNLLYISDIRDLDFGGSGEKLNATIRKNMHQQDSWRRIMNPMGSMLKFRLPWDDEKTVYPEGDVMLPVWGRVSTTECRLIVNRGARDMEYDNRLHESQMYYFNNVARPTPYDQSVRGGGLDRCYDCKAEIGVLSRYLSIIGKLPRQGPLRNETLSKMSRFLSERMHTRRDNLKVKLHRV